MADQTHYFSSAPIRLCVLLLAMVFCVALLKEAQLPQLSGLAVDIDFKSSIVEEKIPGIEVGAIPGDFREGCTVLLSTFPNSGTTWTQAIFTSSTGIVTEAVYKEGPPSKWPKVFSHGQLGNNRYPNLSVGECRFIKSHQRVSYKLMPARFQRAVILYRDPDDNLEANIRYLVKRMKPGNPSQKLVEKCEGIDFNDYEALDPDGFKILREMHYIAHRRFYCHAQKYPIPRLFVTYSALLTDPSAAFEKIMTFIGFPEADLDKALNDHALKNHTVKGNQEYKPIDDEQCTGLNEEFRRLYLLGNECARTAATVLQF